MIIIDAINPPTQTIEVNVEGKIVFKSTVLEETINSKKITKLKE